MNIQNTSKKLSMEDLERLKKPEYINLDIHISLKNNYFYTMISKAASSTVTYHLQYVEFQGSQFTVKNVNSPYHSPHVLPYQLRPAHLLAILQDNDFKKVTIVRNPYVRLLSCYLHRVVGNTRMNPTKKAILRHSDKLQANRPSFAQFINRICSQENRRMERHYALQHDMVMYPLVKYDLIGKVETLHADLLRMEQLLFGREVFDREALQRENRAPMQTGASTKLREYYTDPLAKKVADRYRLDFETFGYSTDIRDAI
jgi:hypothetical protein